MSVTKDALGETIKNARTALGISSGELAERLGIGKGYLLRLENSQNKPSFDLLVRIIRELNIQSDLIFYPEKPLKDAQMKELIHILENCDDFSLAVIRAAMKAALDNQPKG